MPSKSTIPRVCEQCGSSFMSNQREIDKGGAKFCSIPCRAESKTVRVTRQCEQCARDFVVRAAQARHNPARFCNRHCHYAYQRESGWRGLQAKLLARSIPDGECRVIVNGILPTGYAAVSVDGRRLGAHVAAWIAASNIRPSLGWQVLHTCDVRSCVENNEPGIYVIRGIARPRFGHLWLGTHADNMADMADKGRSARGDRQGLRLFPERVARGESNGNSTLTSEMVLLIREMGSANIDRRVIAAEFGIDKSTVNNILRRATWKHI